MRDGLDEFFEKIAEDLADETGEAKAKFYYAEDYEHGAGESADA